MPIAQLKKLALQYECFGDESLPSVFLIMGLGTPAAAWPEGLIKRLLEKGLHVITFDNRDAGGSTHFSSSPVPLSVPVAIGRALLRLPVSAPYRLEDMALDLCALMDHLRLPRAHLVGASMGGMIAQVAATIRPSRVLSLTSIMSATGNPRTGLGKIKAIYSLLSDPGDVSTEEKRFLHYEKVLSALKSPAFEYPEEEKNALLKAVARYPYDAKAGERQLLAILSSADRTRQLQRLTTPTLVIHGHDDPLLPLSAGEELAEVIPTARLEVLPQMGHDLPGIHLDKIAELIAAHVWAAET